MGSVYKVKHTGFDELRALKVLNPELAGDERVRQRFKQEAYITRKLHHPNAVQVDDIDEAEELQARPSSSWSTSRARTFTR